MVELGELATAMANEVRERVLAFAAMQPQGNPFTAIIFPHVRPGTYIMEAKIMIYPHGIPPKKARQVGTYAIYVDPKKGTSRLLWALPRDIPLHAQVIADRVSEDIARSVCETQPILLVS